MSAWFEITGYSSFEIVPVEVVSTTEKTVTVRVKGWNNKFSERRRNKGDDFHQTRDAAVAEVLTRLDRAIESARTRLASAEKSKADFLAKEVQ